MENKETKNNTAEELNDEALDEVTGGTYQFRDLSSGGLTAPKTVSSKKTKASGSTPVPTIPGGSDIRTF